jgi:hypothetical protein
MKNWLPLVLGPLLAIDMIPLALCCPPIEHSQWAAGEKRDHQSDQWYLEGLPELVGELGAPDGGAALAGAGGVAALDHEALDVAVEDGAVVVAAGAEGQEVLRRAGHLVAEHLALDVAQVRVQRH